MRSQQLEKVNIIVICYNREDEIEACLKNLPWAEEEGGVED